MCGGGGGGGGGRRPRDVVYDTAGGYGRALL